MDISRRDFIANLLKLGSGALLAGSLGSLTACSEPDKITVPPSPTSNTVPAGTATPLPTPHDVAYLTVVRGPDTKSIVRSAVKALGGMERFVQPGNDVIIKPNICVDYHTYEYAATTNPDVVGELVRLCLTAGAHRVRVMDQPFGGSATRAYERSGIAKAVKEAGGEMEIMSDIKFRITPLPGGRDITRWPVYADALNTDVLINVPIAKHHSLGRLTLGMKNLMGLIQERNNFHFNLGQRIADLTTLLRPRLTVIDAVRILTNRGPTGGSLDDVKIMNTVIASHDIVAADSCAATLFGLTGLDIPAVRCGAEMGLGITDLSNVRVDRINL